MYVFLVEFVGDPNKIYSGDPLRCFSGTMQINKETCNSCAVINCNDLNIFERIFFAKNHLRNFCMPENAIALNK